MKGTVIEVIPKRDNVTYADFIEKMNEIDIFEDFGIAQIVLPVHHFRDEIVSYLSEHGLSSLHNFNLVTEDITSSSMSINEIEAVVEKFVARLIGARVILVVDPYFYAKSPKFDAEKLFARLLSPLSKDLEQVIFVTNGRKQDLQARIHSEIKILNQKIQITDVVTEAFHDRYWIDPEGLKGVVMGTSLNGLGNKIALVDCLGADDVAEIVKLAKAEGVTI